MPSSTCTFPNARGHELSARLERPEGPVRATAVFAHCFTCSKDLKAARRISRALADRGIAVLSFDFTGIGSSDGEFAASTFTTDVDDLLAAAGYLEEEIAAPTLLVGHSLGGAAVLTAAARLDAVTAVATIGAPADVEHVAHVLDGDLGRVREEGRGEVTIGGRPFTVSAAFLEDLAAQRLTDTVAGLRRAVLLLHAPLDDTVGVDNARLLFEAARHPKSFVSLDDADHLLTDEADARYAASVIAAWAARYLPDAGSAPEPASAMRGVGDAGAYADKRVAAHNSSGLAADVHTRGFTLRVDEPASVGGTETGPTPYEYLGAGLASCTSLTLRMYAERKGWPLDEVVTTVDFDQVHAEDCEECTREDGTTHEGRIERFTRTVTLTGDLDDEQRAGLLRIADRCPVHRTLEGHIHIVTTLER
ncbi:MAG: alpha/beta fold hydrolase [Actinomycetes bacterium]